MSKGNHSETDVTIWFAYQVPNLFEPEEYEQVLNGTRPHAKEAGVPEGDRWDNCDHDEDDDSLY